MAPVDAFGKALYSRVSAGNTKLDSVIANGLPLSTSGTISTQNLVPAGVATANSAVEITANGRDTIVIQTVGTYTGVLSLQGTMNGTNWVTLGGASRLVNLSSGAYSATIASATQSIFETSSSGLLKVRVTALAAVTGSVTVTIGAVDGNALVAIDNSLPAGTAVIGAVTPSGTWNIGSSTPATPTAYSLVTAATTNAAVVKSTAGRLHELTVANLTAAIIYVKFYNKATAPTVGTDVPIMTIPVATGAFLAVNFPALGKAFTTGIGIAVTAVAAANDTTVVTAGAQIHASYL